MATQAVSTGVFTPELWSAKLNVLLQNYGAYTDIVNRKWEGEIKSKGDKVKIQTLATLTVNDYNPNATGFTGITYQDPNADTQELTIDQQKVIAFKVDDIQKVQGNIDMVNKYTQQMAVDASNTKDTYINGLAVANAGTKLNNATPATVTKDNVWAQICNMHKTLSRKNAINSQGVDFAGKRPALVVTPEFYGMLMQATQFFAGNLGDKILRTGQVGTIGVFDVFVSTNIQTVKTGTGSNATYSQKIVGLTSDAITFAEQITKVETLRDVKDIADYVRALHVYGSRVVVPNAVVTNHITMADLSA